MLLFEELYWFKLLPDSYARKASDLNLWLELEECVDGALQAAVRALPALANANWQHLPFSLCTDWDEKLPIIPQEDGRLMEPVPSFARAPARVSSGPDLAPKALPWPPPTSHAESWPLHVASIFSSSAGVLTRGGRLSHSVSQKYTTEACLTAHLLPGLRAEAPHSFPACRRLQCAGGMACVEVRDAAACPPSCTDCSAGELSLSFIPSLGTRTHQPPLLLPCG